MDVFDLIMKVHRIIKISSLNDFLAYRSCWILFKLVQSGETGNLPRHIQLWMPLRTCNLIVKSNKTTKLATIISHLPTINRPFLLFFVHSSGQVLTYFTLSLLILNFINIFLRNHEHIIMFKCRTGPGVYL